MTFLEHYGEMYKRYGASADLTGIKPPFAAQITVTDRADGGVFYATNIGGETKIAPYDYRDRTVAISTTWETLEAMLRGEKDPVRAFLSGEVDAEGNVDHALALVKALKKKKPKGTAKKAEGQPETERQT
ncbi:MAG: SCP2 sterol-binding domain-containing protein [Clostridia bacterium]|nr:SCP2 sterol-binding domain-containing protein [Clostridia bacterium]